jgi:hypothetical protein
MKPTLEDLQNYKFYLIKNALFNTVKQAAGKLNFDKILFKGRYEYDDESSYYFYLRSIVIYENDKELLSWTCEDWILIDRCAIVSEIISPEQTSFELSIEDLEEPFILEKK